MKHISIQFNLPTDLLERLDDAVRNSRRQHDPVLQDMDRNQLMRFALELGLRQLEARASLEESGPTISGVFRLPSVDNYDVDIRENPTVPPPKVRRVG